MAIRTLNARIEELEGFAEEMIKSLEVHGQLITMTTQALGSIAFQIAEIVDCAKCGAEVRLVKGATGSQTLCNADETIHACESPTAAVRH